jgi:uncharacterized protein (TIGR02145 family)
MKKEKINLYSSFAIILMFLVVVCSCEKEDESDNDDLNGTVTDIEGNVYKTVKIGSQTWMAENLNIGKIINGAYSQANDGEIEKYAYSNDPENCNIYGGLYQWREMMQYTSQEGAQGICPDGWHIPTDSEWKILEGTVDSLFGIDDLEWDIDGYYRGSNAGKNLKSTYDWNSDGNGTDLYGFNVLPGGKRGENGTFSGKKVGAYFWTSTETSSAYYMAWNRYFSSYESGILRGDGILFTDPEFNGYSVRCIKDE